MDTTAIHSLKLRDLFAYSNITIRVRCCCLVSPLDFSNATPVTSEGNLSNKLLARLGSAHCGGQLSGSNHNASFSALEGIQHHHPALGTGTNAERVARFSRVGSQRGGTVLPSSRQVQFLRDAQLQSRVMGNDAIGDCNNSKCKILSTQQPVATNIHDKWRSEEAVLLFEANLNDFEEGMGLLRGLYSGNGNVIFL